MRPSPGLGRAELRWSTDRASVWRKVATADAGGGRARVWTRVGSLMVQLSAATATERRVAAQEGAEVSHVATVPLDADVRRGDRLVVGTQTVEVIGEEFGTLSTVKRLRTLLTPWDEPVNG